MLEKSGTWSNMTLLIDQLVKKPTAVQDTQVGLMSCTLIVITCSMNYSLLDASRILRELLNVIFAEKNAYSIV